MNGTIDQRVRLAAQNNVDWYAMMWDLRGQRYVQNADGFRAIDPPPAYHGWAVALPGADIDTLIAPVLKKPSFAVKDASGAADLTPLGLDRGFSATWLWHEGPEAADVSDWQQISTPDQLAEWEVAWTDTSPTPLRQFPDAILARHDVALWGRKADAGYDAGVIANLSEGCVGLSNLFGKNARPAATTLCAQFSQNGPVVGYERGDDLAAALATGWQAIGPLTVWHRQTSP